jgi:hypothetical protein
MNSTNLVVSGARLASLLPATETLPEKPKDVAALNDLLEVTGAPASAVQQDGPESTAASDQELSPAEKALIVMQISEARRQLQEADVTPGVFSTTEDQVAALMQSALAERAEKEGKIEKAVGDGREAKFDERDARWVLSLVSWIGKLKPHGWLNAPLTPEKLDKPSDSLKFALVGDWGTGLYGAPECTSSINTMTDLNYIVHLGDVYYSGTMRECQSNFLAKWPSVAGAKSRACNGNHEMYSGGYGYFDTILPAFNQTSSCFAIENEHWLIVGLDSAYSDHDLTPPQEAWLHGLVKNAGKRKLVLFSHHQPFSHFEEGGKSLVEKLKPLLERQRITAWYWGHEHRCVIYDPHPTWEFHGRCIGHSGYPYFRKPSLRLPQYVTSGQKLPGMWRLLDAKPGKAPRAILLDGPNPSLGSHQNEYGPNGFVTLEFQGRKLIEKYFLSTGQLLMDDIVIE